MMVKLNIKNRLKVICEFCGGYGHGRNVCKSKLMLDKSMTYAGVKTEWGVLKAKYFQERVDDNIKVS